MTGRYQRNSKTTDEEIILRWFKEAIEDKGWVRLDDLHIDQINPKYANSALWLEDSIYVYEMANQLLEAYNRDYILWLQIVLTQTTLEVPFKELNYDSLKRQISDRTPPSLFLISKGSPLHERHVKELPCSEGSMINRPDLTLTFSQYYDKDDQVFVRHLGISNEGCLNGKLCP